MTQEIEYVYDLESYPNCFLMGIADLTTRKIKVFEISFRKDQRVEMFDYLRDVYKKKGIMTGFNNVGYDYPVLHHLLTNKEVSCLDLFKFGNKLIKASYTDEKWRYLVKEKEVMVKQRDLYKIHHFDNKAKSTSLKMLEFNGRSKSIQELPYEVGKYLSSDEIDNLIAYNIKDIKETIKFREASDKQVSFRRDLAEKYNFNSMNWNDTKIGEQYFIMELSKAKVKCYENGKPLQTKRDYIDLVDCILPSVTFDSPEFKSILQWLKKQRITETKGVFSDILEHELGDVAKYARLTVKKLKLNDKPTEQEIEDFKKEKPLCWVEHVELKTKLPKKLGGGFKQSYKLCWNVCESLNVVVDGLEYIYGTGGIHAAVEKRVIKSDENKVIRSFDVSSFYPNLSIKNRFYPEHLTEKFCDIYEHIYNLRKSFGKKTVENAMLKLALNGSYGKSNDKFSPFFDPKFTMQITLNGQLLLSKAIEMVKTVPTVEILMANTDGFEFIVDREHEHLAAEKCKEWEVLTNLTLEDVVYDQMIIRDVNNYIAVLNKDYVKEGDSNLKLKGAYEWEGLPHHKNQSALIIKMAAQEYLINNTNPEDFIRGHKDPYDFMLRSKVPKSSKLISVNDQGEETLLQNICRYYVSTKGESLIKIMPPLQDTIDEQLWDNPETLEEVVISKKGEIQKYAKKGFRFVRNITTDSPDRRFEVAAGLKCKVTNDMDNFDWDIDYDYYIEKCWDLVGFADELFSEDNSEESEE